MNLTRRCALAALTLAFLPADAADQYPAKPIRLVVPWPAGSPADISARAVADRMGASLGKVVFVENKNGAAGTVGMRDVLSEPADGYTLYMLASASLVAPLLYPSSKTDFLQQFDAVGQVDISYSVLAVAPNAPYQNVQDLVAAVRKNPDKFSYVSGGQGTPPHLAAEMLNQQAHIGVTHVPYQVIGQAAMDVSSGLADFIFMGSAGAIPLVKGGKLRALAVTSNTRVSALPDVPTMMESGFPTFVVRPFSGILARKGTAPAIVARLNVELNKALMDPLTKERLSNIGVVPVVTTPQEFTNVIVTESKKWLALARDAKLKVD